MLKVADIIDFLNDEIVIPLDWNTGEKITGVAQFWEAKPGDLSWTSQKENINFSGSLIIIPENGFLTLKSLPCKHPRLAFIKVCQKFFNQNRFLSDITLGKNSYIGQNCSIGVEGFGHGKDEFGIWQRFPHFGKIIIGDNVEIGSNVVINRGVLSNTIIGDNVRIWHSANIGHNSIICDNAVILNGAILCGSVRVGKGAWISPGAIIKNKIQIGYNSQVGLGAVVVKDVPHSTIVAGNPARVIGKVDENTYNMRSY
jgi:UDP-3-O-[3-hydroxymyristoyl] glucosamine N-acyltransferase